MKQFSLEYDEDYGVDSRSGWSVVINGSVLVQLERNPVVAVWRALKKHREYSRDLREWEAEHE